MRSSRKRIDHQLVELMSSVEQFPLHQGQSTLWSVHPSVSFPVSRLSHSVSYICRFWLQNGLLDPKSLLSCTSLSGNFFFFFAIVMAQKPVYTRLWAIRWSGNGGVGGSTAVSIFLRSVLVPLFCCTENAFHTYSCTLERAPFFSRSYRQCLCFENLTRVFI